MYPRNFPTIQVAALGLHILLSTAGVPEGTFFAVVLCVQTLFHTGKGVSDVHGHRAGSQSQNPVMLLAITITKDLPCCTGAFNFYCVQAHGPRQISLQVHSHPNVTFITYFRQHVTEHCTVIGTHSMVQATKTALQPCSCGTQGYLFMCALP